MTQAFAVGAEDGEVGMPSAKRSTKSRLVIALAVAAAASSLVVAGRAIARFLVTPVWPNQADMARPLAEVMSAIRTVPEAACAYARTSSAGELGRYNGGRWRINAIMPELERMSSDDVEERALQAQLQQAVRQELARDESMVLAPFDASKCVPFGGIARIVERMALRDKLRWRQCRERARRAKLEAAIASATSSLLVLAVLLVWLRALRRSTRALQETARRLLSSEARFRHLVEHATDLIVLQDADGRVLYVSPSSQRLLGQSPEEISRHGLTPLVHSDDRHLLERHVDELMTSLERRAAVRYRLRSKQGDYRWFESRTFLLEEPDTRQFLFQSTARDIDDQVSAEESLARSREELRALSFRDELTGLGNRRAFVTLASQQLKLAARTERPAAILFLDLDGLKSINDRLGHQAGDQAIKDAAGLLRATFRDSDVLARLGGDEFAVLAHDSTPADESTLLARLHTAVERHNASAERTYRVSLSVGVVHHDPQQVRTIEELLAEADGRMYEDKRTRGGRSVAGPEGARG